MLRRDFGISMEEADETLPAQEIELLLRKHMEAHSEEGPSAGGEPLSDVPKEFR